MRVLLLANQPERTTRLKMFEGTLKSLGYDVIIPSFGTRNWIKIASLARKITRETKPDIVHIFNVPDVIYHGFGNLRGDGFKKLIYDYRSPWGIETQDTFGAPGRIFGEYFEKELARNADVITTVNAPLAKKVKEYAPEKEVHIIPNYPSRSFSKIETESVSSDNFAEPDKKPIIFIGRVCTQEGIGKLLETAKAMPDREFWIIGSGPFAWWYLWRKPENIKYLGWQPHNKIPGIVKKAKLCLIPREKNGLTPYSTDKSIWKLNEYLNMGNIVVASGISREEPRKNLVIVESDRFKDAIIEHLNDKPQKLLEKDYKYWDMNTEAIKEIYESI